MDWFLYDWDFHYDRVKNFNAHHREVRPGLIELVRTTVTLKTSIL